MPPYQRESLASSRVSRLVTGSDWMLVFEYTLEFRATWTPSVSGLPLEASSETRSPSSRGRDGRSYCAGVTVTTEVPFGEEVTSRGNVQLDLDVGG